MEKEDADVEGPKRRDCVGNCRIGRVKWETVEEIDEVGDWGDEDESSEDTRWGEEREEEDGTKSGEDPSWLGRGSGRGNGDWSGHGKEAWGRCRIGGRPM